MKRKEFRYQNGGACAQIARYSDQNEQHHHRILIDDRRTAFGFINETMVWARNLAISIDVWKFHDEKLM